MNVTLPCINSALWVNGGLQPTSVCTICIHYVTVSWPIYGGGGEEWSMVLFADLTEVTVDPLHPAANGLLHLLHAIPPPW